MIDASSIIITPRLRGGSSQTSLLSFGFKKKNKDLDNKTTIKKPRQENTRVEWDVQQNSESDGEGLPLDNGIRMGTWNVNSIRTVEAELYQYLDVQKPDILMLQETKIRRINLTKDVGTIIFQGARSKNCEEGKYLAGGLATIARQGLMMKKD